MLKCMIFPSNKRANRAAYVAGSCYAASQMHDIPNLGLVSADLYLMRCRLLSALLINCSLCKVHISSPLYEQLLQPQTPSCIRPNPRLKLLLPISPHLRRLDIGRTLVVRLRDHAHHTNQDLLHALDRTPPLGCTFIVIRVVAGRM